MNSHHFIVCRKFVDFDTGTSNFFLKHIRNMDSNPTNHEFLHARLFICRKLEFKHSNYLEKRITSTQAKILEPDIFGQKIQQVHANAYCLSKSINYHCLIFYSYSESCVQNDHETDI